MGGEAQPSLGEDNGEESGELLSASLGVSTPTQGVVAPMESGFGSRRLWNREARGEWDFPKPGKIGSHGGDLVGVV